MTLPPFPDPFNMAAHVLAHARTSPDKVALEVLGSPPKSWTYSELDRDVRGIATGICARGLRPGQRVLIRLGHDVAVPIVYLAALSVDLVPVPVSSQLTKVEITAMARRIAPALVVQDKSLPAPDIDADSVTAAEVMDWRDLPPAGFRLGDPNRPGYIVFTSGTSQEPRAVLHAHRAVWARQSMLRHWAGLGPEDRVLHAGAFNWSYTMGAGLIDPWVAGATALISADLVRPEELPALLSASGATIFAAAPGVFRQTLRSDIPALPQLRHGLSAGEALPDPIRRDWQRKTGTDLHEAFGQSECSTFISGAPDDPAPPGTQGRAQPGRRIAVLEPDEALAIHRDDPGLMLGYLGDEAATKARYRGEWFLTGDRARIDPEGWVTYLGRTDDMLNVGGYRVSPLEIEAVAASFPGVSDCAAFAKEVRPGVEIIALAYAADAPLDEDALARHCAGALARYKQPRALVKYNALPRSGNGKLLRRALKDH